MQKGSFLPGLCKAAFVAVVIMLSPGCSLMDYVPDFSRKSETPTPEPAAEAPQPEPAVKAKPVAKVKPKPEPVLPKTFSPRVAVLLSARKPAYEGVANELADKLNDYEVYDVAEYRLSPKQLFATIEDSDAEALIAIGLPAANMAKKHSTLPTVFCQVFNFEDSRLISGRVKGVAAIPPLELQIEAWKDLDPDIRNVGTVLGPGHEELIDEAVRATEAAGINLTVQTAKSDREMMFLFMRMLPDIDGFLLFPDNRILSTPVLRQIMGYASHRDVRVAVFNRPLLDMGATISTSSVDTDIAETVVDVLNRVFVKGPESAPDITPLNEIDVELNESKLDQFGLSTRDAMARTNRDGAP